MTKLAQIIVYPIKSLDGVELSEVEVLPSSSLQIDRRWVIVDAEQRFVNGKRTPAIHAIRAQYSPNFESVTLSHPETQQESFELIDRSPAIENWLSETLRFPCRLLENLESGFPDDLDAPGPTVVSTETLEQVANWFALPLKEVARRFRPNLTIAAGTSFWEDRLVGPVDDPVPFTIGEVHWLGINPCQRCIVPSRDSLSGHSIAGFQREFAQRRQASLPNWATRERFDHFYRLSVNTRLAPDCRGGKLYVGDELSILTPR